MTTTIQYVIALPRFCLLDFPLDPPGAALLTGFIQAQAGAALQYYFQYSNGFTTNPTTVPSTPQPFTPTDSNKEYPVSLHRLTGHLTLVAGPDQD